jgi:hypothetical protein
MSMSPDTYVCGPNDNPGGDNFMRLPEWFGRRPFDVLPVRIEVEVVRVIDTPQANHIATALSRSAIAAATASEGLTADVK